MSLTYGIGDIQGYLDKLRRFIHQLLDRSESAAANSS
jgi:hypothetical protein